MKPFLQAQKARRHTRFGSLGAQATPSLATAPILRNLRMNFKGQRRQYPIYENGQWVTKPLNLKKGSVIEFHYDMEGDERVNGFLYATFAEKGLLTNERGDELPGRPVGYVREFLFVRPISPANGRATRSKFTIEIPTKIRGLVFYVSKHLPLGVESNYLRKSDINMITTPGIQMQEPDNVFRSPTLGFTPKDPPHDGKTKTVGRQSEHYKLWNGDIDDHGWSSVGYSGDQAKTVSGRVFDGPRYLRPGDPHKTVRTSLYIWRDGNYPEYGGKDLKGWDAIRLNAPIPAGIPIAMVSKWWWHDQDTGRFELGEWWKRKSDVPRTQIWMGEIPKGAVGTHPYGPKKGYKTHTGGFSETDIDLRIYRGNYGLNKYKLDPANYVGEMQPSGDYAPLQDRIDPIAGTLKPNDLRYFAFKVEWWDQKAKKWTEPQIHPPHDLELKNAKGMLIFRFPRQVALDDPDIKKTPFWSITKTYDCYPRVFGGPGDLAIVKRGVIGRLKVLDEKTGEMKNPEVWYDGHRLSATDDIPFNIQFGYGGDGQVMSDSSTRFAVADPKMWAYTNNPAFNNVYWKEGEFSPGSRMIIIGQGLNRFPEIGLTKIKDHSTDKIRELVKNIDRSGDNAGSMDADILKIEHVITTDYLTDSAVSGAEGEIQAIWKNVFGTELSEAWFDVVGTGGTMPDGTTISPLKNQSPTRSTHYTLQYEGQIFEFPYSIAIVKIPKTWVGPVLDFEVAGDTPFLTPNSLKKGEKTYIVSETAFKQIVEQELNLDEEIQYQLDMLAKGLTPETVLVGNDTDHDAIINTAAVVDQDRKDNLDSGEDGGSSGGFLSGIFEWFGNMFKPRESNNWVAANTLISTGTTRLAGFGSAPIIEDVTNKYSADHVSSLGSAGQRRLPIPAETNFNNFDEIEEVYLMNGQPTSPNLGWFSGITPVRQTTVRPAPVARKQFGSIDSQSMHARATNRGNQLDVTLINGVTPPFRGGDRRRKG